MKFKLNALASKLNGTYLGDGSLELSRLTTLEQAAADSVSPLFKKKLFLSCTQKPYVVLANAELAAFAVENGVLGAIVHKNPQVALARLIDIFFPNQRSSGSVHPTAVVAGTATLDPSVTVEAGVVIEADVSIGNNSWIGANAVICRGTVIGKQVRVGPGAVIGHEGFGFAKDKDGPVKLRHVGNVVLEDHVEIGANCCIDRGTLGTTRVGTASKLDNLVQVGHNVSIGKRVFIAAQTGLAGSSVIKDDVMLGGQVGVGDHRVIGEGALVAGQSGVTRDIESKAVVTGTPAIDRMTWLRAFSKILGKNKNLEG